jgi:hypothetical protein
MNAGSPGLPGIHFVKDLLRFGRKQIGLDFDGSFESVDYSAETANWLYVSEALRIASAVKRNGYPLKFKFSWDRKYLKRSAAAYRGLGFDTYLFSAEGHGGGNCPITPALLASERARQGYVVIHEGWHSSLRKESIRLPYAVEEATGRAIGCFGIIEFARECANRELLARAICQEKDWSRFARFINRWHGRLQKMYEGVTRNKPARKAQMLAAAEAEATKLRGRIKTSWEARELDARLSNAFFLRYHSYTCFYSLAADIVKACGSVKEAAQAFRRLGGEEDPVRNLKSLARSRS